MTKREIWAYLLSSIIYLTIRYFPKNSLLNSQNDNIYKQPAQLILPQNQYNFAQFQGGATIVEMPIKSRRVKSLLEENPDTYWVRIIYKKMTSCYQVNVVIIRLTEDILIEQIAIINKEFYSSRFEKFILYGSTSYPKEYGIIIKVIGFYQEILKHQIQQIGKYLK